MSKKIIVTACPFCMSEPDVPEKSFNIEFETKHYAHQYFKQYPQRFEGLVFMLPNGKLENTCGHRLV